MCKFCNRFREMDYMDHMGAGFGGGFGRYCDPDGFDYDPGEGLSRIGGPAKFAAQLEEKQLPPPTEEEIRKPKKIKRRPTSRLAKYGITKSKAGKKASTKVASKSIRDNQ
mmetsp:Transcript_4324/g.6156  ORF Transcript_4324/g.6156 Transcript_4324/m.6156 type:complete len:110 (+) Transcript_4324:215-544(+)|eukprot:CAMPEP_0184483670 /NCGR_PEP_ID=MMETSP0113_2-20130426/5350_1 /TAXON_ID=91329 /ORGANISM="Norrisiella sphaerica, Strain BC52" /LENGTH=109 /DNA_ID=CAMNT_0026864223 /DNA_START=215 /DNA_END=544 /DNA_ORIENTATION=-